MNSLIPRTRFHRDHRWTPNHLSDFVDGDLSPRGRRRLERHVGICPECYRALVTLQRMLDRLHQLPRPAAREMPGIVSGVRRRLNEQAEG
jgi:anti-sigma factor RsiW